MKKLTVFFLLFVFQIFFAQETLKFNVNGFERETVFFVPENLTPKMPLVFVFHGHGGNAKFAAKKMDFQNYFPEAIVVFMQGIPGTSGHVIDKEGKMNGWQMFPGQNGNRDVLFFDEVLKFFTSNLNIGNVYVVGHSNGARFVNVLWKERPQKISAIVSVAAQGGMMIRNADPISVWMSMGKNDPLVPYKNQKNSVPIVQKNLKIDSDEGTIKGDKTYYKGEYGKELVVEERDAGHEFPQESIPEMVEFMKRNSKN